MAMDRYVSRRTVLQSGAYGSLAAVLLAACGKSDTATTGPSASGPYTAPGADATGTLRIQNWGDPSNKAVYTAVKQRFAARYPKVTVNDDFTAITTWPDYINKLVANVAAGQPPDVINIAVEGMQLGLSKKLFAPLDGYLSRDDSAKKVTGDVNKVLTDSVSFDGKPYFLPNNWNTMLMYYNTKMFKAAGLQPPSDDWTWDDFLAAAKKLTTGNGATKVYGFAIPYFNFGLTPWWYSNGTSEFNADLTAPTFDDPKMVEAVTFVTDLVRKHQVSPQPKGLDPYQLFQSGKVAMTGAGHWTVGQYEAADFTDYDVVSWPKKAAKATVFGASGFGIYPGSKNPDLAWEYAKELAGPKTQADWVRIGGANPASQTAGRSRQFTAFPKNAQLFYDSIDYAKPLAAPRIMNVVEPELLRQLDQVLNGSKTPQQAMADMQKAMTSAFQD